uniref:Uncharacterized protein n=1 Tax=Manihot esculenta TaxID=3983 RepID=A0A199UBB6_MANES
MMKQMSIAGQDDETNGCRKLCQNLERANIKVLFGETSFRSTENLIDSQCRATIDRVSLINFSIL